MGARLAGAEPIIVADLDEAKLERARVLGATTSSTPAATTSSRPSSARSRGRDWAIEAVGRAETLQQAVACLRPGGTAVALGIGRVGATFEIPINELVQQQKRVVGSLYGSANPPLDLPRLCGSTAPAACRSTRCSAPSTRSTRSTRRTTRSPRARSAGRCCGRDGQFATYPSLRGQVAFVSGGASGPRGGVRRPARGAGRRVGFVDVQDDAGQALARDRGRARPPRAALPALRRPRRRRAAGGDRRAGRTRLGPVTVLVNNAANDQRHPVETLTVQEWDDRIAVNVRHHFFATQAVAPMMRAAGGGSIINLGSISAHIDLLDLPVYITAKAGDRGPDAHAGPRARPDGIRVNCVIPGWIMTERQLTHWVTPEAEASHRAQPVPAGQALPGRRRPPGALARGRRQPLLHRAAVDRRRRLDVMRQAERSPSPAPSTAKGRSGTRRTPAAAGRHARRRRGLRSTPTARSRAPARRRRRGRAAARAGTAGTCSPPSAASPSSDPDRTGSSALAGVHRPGACG